MKNERQVVVTGLGVVSPIGIGVDAFWESLLAGRSGVVRREEFAPFPWPLKIHAPVSDFDGREWVRPRKALKVMCRPIQFGYAAAMMALEHSGLSGFGIDPERLGTVFASETFFSDPDVVASVFFKCMEDRCYVHRRWGETAMREIEPLWMLKYLPNMVTSHVSIAADARGPSNTICQAEASSLLALIEGTDLIRRGLCDAVIVGGTGSQTSLSAMLYRGQQLLSHRTDQPHRACRPFDRDRDGTVFGEGAGAMVLEDSEHALQRGATILGSVAAWSRTFCPPASNQFCQAIGHSMQSALSQSKVGAADLSHVNAHGSCLRKPDIDEAQAIRLIAGDALVLAVKSNFGYLGPASGIIELIASIQSLNERLIPPTLNHETPDPDCPVNVGISKSESDKTCILKNSFSSNGQIVSMVITK